MPIVQTVDSYHDFRDAFRVYDRLDNFTHLEWLFDHLEECYSDDTYELDVIALCCEYTESTYDEVARDYSIDLPGTEDFHTLDFETGEPIEGTYEEEEHTAAKRDAIREYLNDNTTVVNHDDETIMFAVF